MKITKKDKLPLKVRASETYHRFKQKFGVHVEHIQKRGHEKMTIMFIPHNEKKLVNFQISKFTIAFFAALFVIIIVTSGYAIIKDNAAKREEQRLMSNYADIRSHLLRFEKLTVSVEELVDELKPEIEELYKLAAGSENIGKIWDVSRLEDPEFEKIKNIMPDEVFALKEIQRDMVSTTNAIKTIKNFVDVRNKVIQDTPSIVSNPGHITSLFGWRRSPFGHGKDFHTGIDIAAAPGTAIVATAPGTVVASGWSGGYGNAVHLRHKYGFETIYAHCQTVAVSEGQYIQKGQIVGYVGQTGNATGPHCHYEIRMGGVAINPYPYMSRVW
jgi:murein DD-endopeptidase MepM/ murein hydrolase activator NlpD